MNRRFKFLLLACSPVAIVAIAALYMVQAGVAAQADFDTRIAALQTAGQPISIKDLAHKPPLPHENAATYLRRANSSMESIDKEWDASYENLSHKDQTSVDIGRLPKEFADSLRETLNAYREALSLVEQAVSAPSYDSQLDYSADPATFLDELVNQSQINRRAVRVLGYQASLQLADGNPEGSLKTSLKMLKLCRLFDREPTIYGSLVALACREVALGDADLALRAGPISEPVRTELDEELARSNIVRVYRDSLASDRAFGLDTLREIESGKLSLNSADERFLLTTPAAFAKDRAKYLDYMAQGIALTGRPYADLKTDTKLSDLMAEIDPSTKVLSPGMACQVAVCRGLVNIRSVQILNAIQRFERDHAGAEPKLTDLGLPAEVTTDPFDGRPLRVVKLPQGWSVYSVDMDLKDDGGRMTPPDHGFLVNRIGIESEAEAGR